MKMYEVEVFNSINEAKSFDEIYCSQCRYIAKESDLESLKEKGGGFRILRYIGELYIPEDKSLSIIIKPKIEGLEEDKKLIEKIWEEQDKKYINNIIKLDEEFKKYNQMIEEKLAKLEKDSTPNNYTININWDNKSSEEIFKQITNGLKKLGM